MADSSTGRRTLTFCCDMPTAAASAPRSASKVQRSSATAVVRSSRRAVELDDAERGQYLDDLRAELDVHVRFIKDQ
jgi:hypothetical protein